MQIHIDGELAEPFFTAINEAPFSEEFKKLFINEVLTAPGLRFGASGILGFFDGSDISAIGGSADQFVTRARISGPGELMIAALRALRCPPEVECGHGSESPTS
jgi:hypothetical protein